MLIALLLTGFTFAYWAGNIQSVSASNHKFSGDTVEVGVGHDVKTTIKVDELTGDTTKVLVPKDRKVKSNDVTSIDRQFKVEWKDDTNAGLGAKGTVKASDIKVLVNGVTYNNNDLFKVVISDASIDLNATTTMTATIQFNREPKDKVEYDLVAGKDLNLQLTLTVSENK